MGGGGASRPKLLPLLRAAFTHHPLLPPTLSLSHTPPQSGCCFVVVHKHSHRKEAENYLPPFFTYYPPQPTPHPLRGCIGAKKGIPPHFLSSLLSLPPISHTRTHTRTGTHGQEHRRTYKLNPPGQQLYMR